jgi:hypothetical protein
MKLFFGFLFLVMLAPSAWADRYEIQGTVTSTGGAIPPAMQPGGKWLATLSTSGTCQSCSGGDPTGLTDLEMNIFGAVQGIASDDIGPANVEF